jgi:hypothetical protein
VSPFEEGGPELALGAFIDNRSPACVINNIGPTAETSNCSEAFVAETRFASTTKPATRTQVQKKLLEWPESKE